ncbi:GNAT family protein [Bacillus sp. CBEL-1]|uniref:GNAT family N-acetyltransferase n=1 Tax=Bacillus sp. CBEL-1 TaxID=2502980 RepID=UPI0010518FBD|nr:GNAT family protein [Bacillus sp. CBEL-1]TDB49740.1 N-acetyltransferase [Bacillus sp. CBEL-1]USY53399.1 GNAT family N-acetyltransferase [Bacillus sp. 1780r2a1]
MIQICGEKTVLTELSDSDLDEYYYWKFEEEQKEAKKWNGPYIPEPWKSKEEFKQLWVQANELLPGVPRELAIKGKGSSKFIGTVGTYWVDRNTNWAETGIVIYNPDYWSGGYGTDAYRLWIDFLFENTNLHRLGMSTWSGNHRMLKVANKIGMKEEARIRDARMVDGKYYDAVKMGILKTEWDAFA